MTVARFIRDRYTGRIFDSVKEATEYFDVSRPTLIKYANNPDRKSSLVRPWLGKNISVEWVTLKQIAEKDEESHGRCDKGGRLSKNEEKDCRRS